MKSRQEIERLARRKRKNKLTLILSCAFVVSLITAILLAVFLPEEEPENTEKPTPEIIEGEALYNNYALAYPTMEESQITRITIKNNGTEYTLMRGTDGASKGSFVLFYQDENGEIQPYYPDIIDADSSFDYESLYAIEQNDGYNRIYKLTYLCSAIEHPYFDERIPLESDEAERAFQYKQFGLDEPKHLRFDFLDEKGVTYSRHIKIGDKNPTGYGYYYMVSEAIAVSDNKDNESAGEVEYRPYIYNSTSNYYDYALLGFESYVHSMLVAKGLTEDSSYEPYLTTDFKHWVNQTYKEAGTEVEDNSNVIIYTDMLVPLENALDSKMTDENKDGYVREAYDILEVDLSKYKNRVGFERLVKALSEAKVGVLYDKEQGIGSELDQIIVTLASDSKAVNLEEKDSVKYKYTVTAIEAILTDGKDRLGEGTVAENDKIRVTYTLSVDGQDMTFKGKEGEPGEAILYHAVLDLSEKALPSEARALVGKSIGELGEPVAFEIDYSAENSVDVDIQCKIVEIISVYNSEGASIKTIAEDSIVTYRYVYVINGVAEEPLTAAINLGTDDTETGAVIKEKLIGRTASKNLNILAYEYTEHCEYLQDFITYEIARIDYFVTSEIVTSFRFQNASDRDPYYGESIYENTLENKYGIYGLNSSVCEQVVKILGGVGETTGSSSGLVGTETVAVGITPEIKEKYGLYAHTIYFELPRGIIVRDSGDDEDIDDYTYYETLGFTLYISEVDPLTNMRYVGSDLYDIVATVSAENFVFLEYDFVNFWARRNLMLMDVEYIDYFNVDFSMEDIAGSYNFTLDHGDYYLEDGKAYPASKTYKGETFDFITVNAADGCKCSGECTCTETKLLGAIRNSEKLNKNGEKIFGLADLYDLHLGQTEGYTGFVGTDTYGTTYFKELLEMLYFTQYVDTLTPEQQASALESAPLLMRFEIKLRDTYTRFDKPTNASRYAYVYEFYRCDDRRIMVSLYQIDADGNALNEPVTDFYISTLAFKKIVSNFYSVFNAEEFDPDVAYPS